jgi:hypothetical protein
VGPRPDSRPCTLKGTNRPRVTQPQQTPEARSELWCSRLARTYQLHTRTAKRDRAGYLGAHSSRTHSSSTLFESHTDRVGIRATLGNIIRKYSVRIPCELLRIFTEGECWDNTTTASSKIIYPRWTLRVHYSSNGVFKCSKNQSNPCRSQWPRRLKGSLERWGRVFESRSSHGYLYAFIPCLCCAVCKVTALRRADAPSKWSY